jgi:glutamate transport system permease protein
MSQPTVLYDVLGPKGRRNVRIGTGIGVVVVLAIVAWIFWRLAASDQLEAERWGILFDTESGVPQSLGRALLNTLRAAAVAMALSMLIGAFLAAGRLSDHGWVRAPVSVVVQFFRGIPLLLLIFFVFLGLPRLGINLDLFWSLVVGLTAYNMAVLAEIFRAGVLSIDRGQSEAGYALGLRKSQVMRLILVPQAVRRMLPAIVSQLVTLLKDTSLGFVIGYFELLRQGRSIVEFLGPRYGLQIYVAVAVMYIAVNLALSMLARYLDKRTSRNPKVVFDPKAEEAEPLVPLGRD